MKKQLTMREKVLMCILAVMIIFCIYNYAFYMPVSQEIAALKLESESLDEQALLVDAEVAKLDKMKQELEAIQNGEMGEVKEIPAYDNGKNVMNSLSVLLGQSDQYSVNFSTVEEDGNTVRRNISLSYSCGEYETAKAIFTGICEGDYRCLIKDVHIAHNDSYEVTLSVTYFEYK